MHTTAVKRQIQSEGPEIKVKKLKLEDRIVPNELSDECWIQKYHGRTNNKPLETTENFR